jgi:CRISPR system Cascade subunit CasC
VLIEVRQQKTPVSYANAFVKPARANGQQDLVEDSLQKFTEHVGQLTQKFSLKTSRRFWFCTRDIAPNSTDAASITTAETLDDLLSDLSNCLEERLNG